MPQAALEPPVDMSRTTMPLAGVVAINAGKAVRFVSRTAGRGGTALPGRAANRIHPGLVSELTRALSNGSVVVAGTNGKTTTTRLLASALRGVQMEPVTNREGANLMQGIATALLARADSWGRFAEPSRLIGLFEVDEGVVPAAMREIVPRLVLITNLFRDQLDRYFEIDFVAALWTAALSKLPPTSSLVLNADDPLVAHLGSADAPADEHGPHAITQHVSVVYYGLEDAAISGSALERNADSRRCPRCSADLEYERTFYAHLGHYRCPACGWHRPIPSVKATHVERLGGGGSRVDMETPFGSMQLTVPLPGTFNVYNALAAAAAAISLGVPPAVIGSSVATTTSAFGRMETVKIAERLVSLELVKNPSGFNQVLDVLLREPGQFDLLLALNNQPQDSRDVSWIWDVNVEAMAGRLRSLTLAGARAPELALRLKYGAVPIPGDDASLARRSSQPVVGSSLTEAFDAALAATPSGGTLHVIANYSAMWDVRQELVRRGHLRPFWEA